MSRDELLAEIDAVQEIVGTHGSLRDVVQELHVHQEEVRVQQHQLLDAQRTLEESRDRYADLYDFAPIAFVTLDRGGVIQEANLAAAGLLGVERARLKGFPCSCTSRRATGGPSSITSAAAATAARRRRARFTCAAGAVPSSS